MLREVPAVILLSPMRTNVVAAGRKVGIKDRQPAAHLGQFLHEMENVRSVEVIKHAQAQDNIKGAVLG